MSQSPSFGNSCVNPWQCLVGIAETEEDSPPQSLKGDLRVVSYLLHERIVGDWIVKCEGRFEMRPGQR